MRQRGALGTRVAEMAGEHTVASLLRRNAEEHGEWPALSSGIGTEATTLTWRELFEQVAAVAHGLSAAGLRAGDRMLIDVPIRPEHWVADYAAVHVGAIPCTIYPSTSTEQLRHIGPHNGATVVVLEGREQLQRWRPVLESMPTLRSVVLLDADVLPTPDSRFLSYSDLLSGGRTTHRRDPELIRRRREQVTPGDPVTMIYTSGTTGAPKGVVLSHRSVLYQAAAQELIQPVPEHSRQVAYLPLAHVAERILSMYLPLFNAGHITTIAETAQLAAGLRAVRPHGFFGVPRVWEKFAAAVDGALSALPEEERAAVDAAREIAARVYSIRADGAELPTELAAALERADPVLQRLRAQLGLEQTVRFGKRGSSDFRLGAGILRQPRYRDHGSLGVVGNQRRGDDELPPRIPGGHGRASAPGRGAAHRRGR